MGRLRNSGNGLAAKTTEGVIRIKFLIIGCLVLFCFSGCLFLPQKLKILKNLGDSQQEIEAYLARQVELFNELLAVLKKEGLKPGMPKNEFIQVYGEPILSKETVKPTAGEMLLYRRPTDYFQSERIYLYFDENEKLVRWEHKSR